MASTQRSKRVLEATPAPTPGGPAAKQPATREANPKTHQKLENFSPANLKRLLDIEISAREADNTEKLTYLIANQLRKLVRARQVFVFSRSVTGKSTIATISGMTKVDRTVPLLREIEQTICFLEQSGELQKLHRFAIPQTNADPASALAKYPFRKLLWLCLENKDGTKLGGVLLSRQQDWSDEEAALLRRASESFSHALTALGSERRRMVGWNPSLLLQRRTILGAALGIALLMLFPVSMTALAPLEVAPRNPFIIAAHLDGSIKEVLVEPGQQVAIGQTLLRYSDTVEANRLAVALQEVSVGEAQLKRTSQLALDTREGSNELGTAISELELRRAELKLAQERAAQTLVTASTAGVAVFSDKQSLLGKPVTIGERIMAIADPADVEIAVDLPVQDSILLEEGARVKLFLDSSPLNAKEATVEYIDYKSRPTPEGGLAYRIVARLDEAETDLPRMGVKGTAQLYGDTVPLGLYLFRRPITAMRQWLGV